MRKDNVFNFNSLNVPDSFSLLHYFSCRIHLELSSSEMLKWHWRLHDRLSIMIIQLFFLAHNGLKWFCWNKFATSQTGNKNHFDCQTCAFHLYLNFAAFSTEFLKKYYDLVPRGEVEKLQIGNYHQCPIFSPTGIPSKKQLNAAKILTRED